MAFIRAVAVGEIPAGTIREVSVNGKAVAVANVGGEFHAIDNTCLHRGGPLGDGPLEGKIVTCPWHGWQYDVTTGKVVWKSYTIPEEPRPTHKNKQGVQLWGPSGAGV